MIELSERGSTVDKSFSFKIKLFIISLLLICISFIEINYYTNIVCAILTLVFSGVLLYKARKNLLLILIFGFIFYCNYSIVVGEYIVGGDLGVSFDEVKNPYYYGINIRIILLFTSIVAIFLDPPLNIRKVNLIPKDNIYIFGSIIFILVLILIFGVDRSPLTSYSVRITPIYEYGTILFLFAYYFSGKSNVKRYILLLLMILFILQDFYYGGRITSLQLIFLLISVLFSEKFTKKPINTQIILYGVCGVFLYKLIGEYRKAYSLNSVNILDLFRSLISNYFVFDTPIYAYYASATHIAASEVAGLEVRLNSLLAFVKAIFIGSRDINSNITKLVAT